MISACKDQALWIAGMRRPRIENKRTIFKFLKNIRQDTLDTYTLDSNLLKTISKKPFKPGWPPSFRPIQIRTYNHKGKIVMQWASCEGFLKDLKTFDSVPPRNINGLDTTLTLQEDIGRYFTLDGKYADVKPPGGFDYYIVVYFARYFPGMSRKSFHEISLYKSRHPELKIKTYKIDVDINEFWKQEINFPVVFGFIVKKITGTNKFSV